MTALRRTSTLALLLIIAVTALTGCGQSPSGSITIGLMALPASLDPASVNGGGLLTLIYETLLASGPDGGYSGGLASAWSAAADGRTVTLTIRDGVRFSDGTALTAAAVMASLERLRKVDQTALGPVDRLSADGQTLTITLTRPYPPLWDMLADARTAIVRETPDGLVGTGPYVRRPSTGSDATATIELTASPDYRWAPAFYRSRGPARVASIVLRSYGEEADLAAAVTAGEVDIASGAGLTPPAGWQIVTAPGQAITYLGFSTTAAPLDDARVRRAIAVLVRDGIAAKVSTISSGVKLATGYLPGGVWGASTDVPSGDAVALLTEAGYVRGADGTRVKDGRPLRLTIVTSQRQMDQNVGSIVWEALTASGIGADLNADGGAGAGAGEAFIGRYAWSQPDVLFYLFHSGAAANRFGYADDGQDRLLEAAAGAMNLADRQALYRTVQSRLAADVPLVPLLEDCEQWLVRPGLANVRAGTGGRLFLLSVTGAK